MRLSGQFGCAYVMLHYGVYYHNDTICMS